MSAQHNQDARDRYHFAKLALFNVRLLALLQNMKGNSEALSDVIEREAGLNGMEEPPSLLHQATFLQFSYVCLVWLWESAKNVGIEDELLDEYPKVAKRLNLTFPENHQIAGERSIKDWRAVIRLLRNALGHGRIKVTDTSFEFSDQNRSGRNAEGAPTTLTLTWEELAKISEVVIHSLTPVLWPTPANTLVERDPAKARRTSP